MKHISSNTTINSKLKPYLPMPERTIIIIPSYRINYATSHVDWLSCSLLLLKVMFNISHSLWNSLNCRSLRFSVDSIRWLIDGSLCDQWINVSRVSLTSYLLVEVSRQNVRLCRSILVISSASFSEEFVLLTESLHPSNSSVSLVTNKTSRHESMN